MEKSLAYLSPKLYGGAQERGLEVLQFGVLVVNKSQKAPGDWAACYLQLCINGTGGILPDPHNVWLRNRCI